MLMIQDMLLARFTVDLQVFLDWEKMFDIDFVSGFKTLA